MLGTTIVISKTLVLYFIFKPITKCGSVYSEIELIHTVAALMIRG